MANSLQSRVAGRGFPVFDTSGQSGQGALPDSTLPSGIGPGDPSSTWTDPNVDPASVGASLPPPEAYVLGQTLWGLSGAVNPDNTPRTHAAPFADKTLAWQDGRGVNSEGIAELNAELEATHAPEFNGVEIRSHPATKKQFDFDQQAVEGGSNSDLQPLTGQIRSQAGFDGVQGYGGGGDGPRGTNETMPLIVLDRQFPGPEGNPTFLNAAEVPLYTADALQFIAAAPELPEWTGGGFDVPTANVSAQDVISADTPAQGPPVAATPGVLALMWS